MVDREDDLKIGIKSSAILFGRFDVIAVMVCYMMMLACLAMLGHALIFGYYYYGGLGSAGIFAVYHYCLIKNRESHQCFKAFLNNSWLGGVIFAGIIMQHYFNKVF